MSISPPAAARHPAVTAFAAATLVTILAGSSVPTPLYRLYQREWSLSPLALTTAFAIYALSLLASLLTVGSLSDHVGRRPVIFGGLVLSMVAMVLFIDADSFASLLTARIVQGLAAGAVIGALGAAILDGDPARGPLVNSVAPFVGTGFGAFGSSMLAAWAPAPTRLGYAVLLATFALEALLVWRLPETARRLPGVRSSQVLASLRPHLAVPPQASRTLLVITPGNVAIWALNGFYLSVMPSVLRAVTGIDSPLTGGIVVAIATLCAGIAILALRHRHALAILSIGTTSLALGVATTLFGLHVRSVAAMIVGTMLAGAGVGAGFFGSARTLLPLAAAHERAGLLSAFYAQSYLAFSLPVILLGLAIPRFGLMPSAYVYGAIVVLLAATSLLARWQSGPSRPATHAGN